MDEATKPKRKRQRKAAPARLDGVRRELVKARRLVVVMPTDPIWSDPVQAAGRENAGFAGALVQLRPPAAATDETIQGLADAIRRDGAAGVDTLPRLSGAALLVKQPEQERQAGLSARLLVLDMAAKSASGDRAGLADLLGAIMDEVGL